MALNLNNVNISRNYDDVENQRNSTPTPLNIEPNNTNTFFENSTCNPCAIVGFGVGFPPAILVARWLTEQANEIDPTGIRAELLGALAGASIVTLSTAVYGGVFCRRNS